MKNESEFSSNVTTSVSPHDSNYPPEIFAEPGGPQSPSKHPILSTRAEEAECSAEMRTILREFLADECLLTVRNQNTLCCYWDITPDCVSKTVLQKSIDEEREEAILLTWPPQSLFDFNYQVLPVSFASRHVYLRVPFPGQVYQVEIGWICRNGVFVSILTSNQSTFR